MVVMWIQEIRVCYSESKREKNTGDVQVNYLCNCCEEYLYVRLPFLPSYLKIWIQALADYLESLHGVKFVHTSASQPGILLRRSRVERFCSPVKCSLSFMALLILLSLSILRGKLLFV
jgi:hypothetical protein